MNAMKNFIDYLHQIPLIFKKLIMLLTDSVLLILILLVSFSIRLDYWFFPNDQLFWVIFLSPLIGIPIFYSFRLYSSVIRHIELEAFSSIIRAISLYAVTWGLICYLAAIEGIIGISEGVPRSVILINWMLSIIIIGSTRLIARWVFSYQSHNENSKKENIIIYGTGDIGIQLSNALKFSSEYNLVAYVDEIDDEKSQKGRYLNGIPVFTFDQIQKLIEKYNVREVLLASSLASRKKRFEIIDLLSPFSVKVRSLPSMSDLAEGKIKINELKEFDIKDLLGRDSIKSNFKLLKTKVTKKIVLVTGAGGSIGSELCRQILFLKPKMLILFEVSESSLYLIEQEIRNLEVADVEVLPIIGSVTDTQRINNVLNHYQVQTVYHAAAYKHVPLVEYNQSQGVINNAIGTLITAKASINSNVETFVLISTDKAVRPTSTMGATKRIAELVLQALSEENHSTCLTMVRFGNVLDSSGSVIPLFRKQIQKGGPVTVTDPEVVRYFMTIPEAVELVIQAGAMGKGGDVFVLDMGEPVKINDLALKMIQLSGLQVIDDDNPDGDIEINYTGLRPGEKLYEELLVGKNLTKTSNKLIMRAKEEMIIWEELNPMLIELEKCSLTTGQDKIRELIMQIVPEFSPQSSIVDHLHK
jgi:FlaA1/EpsC-like NDP-sugar epimerase